jgi:hypothetical protein
MANQNKMETIKSQFKIKVTVQDDRGTKIIKSDKHILESEVKDSLKTLATEALLVFKI